MKVISEAESAMAAKAAAEVWEAEAQEWAKEWAKAAAQND